MSGFAASGQIRHRLSSPRQVKTVTITVTTTIISIASIIVVLTISVITVISIRIRYIVVNIVVSIFGTITITTAIFTVTTFVMHLGLESTESVRVAGSGTWSWITSRAICRLDVAELYIIAYHRRVCLV